MEQRSIESGPEIERLAIEIARSKTNVAKWGLHIVVFLFALLIAIILLASRGIGTDIVAPLAVAGLAAVWLMGELRGRQLYKRFYAEELSRHHQEPGEEATALVAKLSPREMEALNYMAQGYANKEIASELGISENTVKNFVSAIFTKLNAKGRTEAVVIAIKQGLVSVR